MNRIHVYPEEARLCFSLCFCIMLSCSLWRRVFFFFFFARCVIILILA